jgi:hypothetical protein
VLPRALPSRDALAHLSLRLAEPLHKDLWLGRRGEEQIEESGCVSNWEFT